MARAATSPELALFRSSGQWSRVRAAIYPPTTIYAGRVNQSFSSLDRLLEVVYDGGTGTLPNVLPDMTVFFGSSAGAWDKGIARLRSIDSTKLYIGESADLNLADNQYFTIVDDFGLWAKPILMSGGVPYMDGGEAFTDQFTNWLPIPKMGPNLVLKKIGSTISHAYNFAGSTVPGSAVASYSTSAPGSSSISGATTSTPTVTWNSVGWKKIYLTLTGANGKVYFAVRYVFIWDDDHLPPLAQIDKNPKGNVDSGGWEFGITLFDDADLTAVRDHALVILFSEDHYGPWYAASEESIGPVSGAENILAQGWIAKESIDWDSEAGSVSFSAFGPQYFFGKIPAWPFGVEFTSGTPSSWTQIKNLTVDLGLTAFLQYATTATRIMDITLTGDTRLTKEVSSLASNLWAQMQEIAFDQIYARPLINCLGQLFVEIHPQLTPTGSRTWPTVFDILPQDILRPIDFERSTMDELSILDFSGLLINSSGKGTAFFSLAPGHSHSHYGTPDVQPKRLLASQSQSNVQAGLYRSWINNPYKSITLPLAANNRLVDIAPRQKCTITIDAGDTKRGISYSGGLIPLSVERVHDRKSGHLRTDITFEGETSEGRAENGDVPGSVDISVPPLKPFPPLPPLGSIFPGGFTSTPAGPQTAVLHDPVGGFILLDLSSGTPRYSQINAGLTPTQYSQANVMFVTPGGAFYAGYAHGPSDWLARAPSVGGTFVMIATPTELYGAGYNPLLPDYICAIMDQGAGRRLYAGAGGSLASGAVTTCGIGSDVVNITYGLGKWLSTTYDNWQTFSSNGLSVNGSGFIATGPAKWHVRGSTTGKTIHERNGTVGYVLGDNNLATHTEITDASAGLANWGRTIGIDLSGLYLMTGKAGSLVGQKSSDGGVSWASSAIPLGGNWRFAYAGPGASLPRFMAAAASVYYTPDFGGSWTNLTTAELLGITPFPGIDMLQVVEF